MSELTYTSGVTGQVFDLDSKLSWGAANALRSRHWEYTLEYRGMSSPVRKAREVSVNMTIEDVDELDALMQAADSDVLLRKPGTITALSESGGVWRQRAVIVESSPQSHYRAPDANIDLTVLLMDGVWRRRLDVQRLWADALQPGLDLDYPHDYPHDYMSTVRNATVVNPMPAPMPFEMVWFGPVSKPQLTLGGNRYELDMDIPSGGYVTISSVEGEKSIILTTENGDMSNVFSKGVRTGGENGGSYIFQPIPSGELAAQWNGFGIDLTIIEEASEPQWV